MGFKLRERRERRERFFFHNETEDRIYCYSLPTEQAEQETPCFGLRRQGGPPSHREGSQSEEQRKIGTDNSGLTIGDGNQRQNQKQKGKNRKIQIQSFQEIFW